MATPTPQTALPSAITANGATAPQLAWATAPAQRIAMPASAAYRRPRESLNGRETKT